MDRLEGGDRGGIASCGSQVGVMACVVFSVYIDNRVDKDLIFYLIVLDLFLVYLVPPDIPNALRILR